MAVSDTTVYIAIGIIFIYLIVYRKNKIFGNMGYVAISLAAWYYGDSDTEKVIGLVMFFGSLINMIYDLVIVRAANTRKLHNGY